VRLKLSHETGVDWHGHGVALRPRIAPAAIAKLPTSLWAL
jgi:hypothetical protein